MKTYAPSLTKSFAVANPIPSVPPVMTAILPSSFLVIVSLRYCGVVSPAPILHARSRESQHRLAQVIGQMVRAAQQNGEAIARSVFGEKLPPIRLRAAGPSRTKTFFQTPSTIRH